MSCRKPPESSLPHRKENWSRAICQGIAPVIAEIVAPLKLRIAELETRPTFKYLGVFEQARQYSKGNFALTKEASGIAAQTSREAALAQTMTGSLPSSVVGMERSLDDE